MPKLLATCLLIFASGAFAQTPDTATIQGQVTDPSRAAVPGRSGRRQDQQRRVGADRAHRCHRQLLAGRPSGSGQVPDHGHQAGLRRRAVKDVTLAGGATAGINLQLNVAGGQTQVTVIGTVGEVRTDAPQIGTRLGARQMEETPLLTRHISNLPLLNAANRPAINQGDVYLNQTLFTTNGAGRRQALYVTDGATNSDSWGRQTLFANLPVLAVEEMNVLANAFSARIRRHRGRRDQHRDQERRQQAPRRCAGAVAPGGHGRRTSGFTAANATSGNQLTSDSLGQSAASLGGALSTRTHFFAAGEFSREIRGRP